MNRRKIRLRVNDMIRDIWISQGSLLLDVIRDELGLKGAKKGCGKGECGACTVIVDGMPMVSCIYPATKAEGRSILTIEGLGNQKNLHPLQKQFLEKGAVQCGFCTPGLILSSKALLDKNPNPGEYEILLAISGNLCRCTGYNKVVEAIKACADELTGKVATIDRQETITGSVGRSVIRVDGIPKVTGKAIFAEDISLPNMLYASVLRSPYPCAQIVSINCSEAEKLPGVKVVLTAKDIPGSNRYGIMVKDQPYLAEEKVRFVGDPISVVAAETKELARQALKKIHVEYKQLPAVFDPIEAMKPGAPKVHESGNILYHRKIRKGNIEDGFGKADVIIEKSFKSQTVEHAYIEPEAAVAYMDHGQMVVHCCTQASHYTRSEIAEMLHFPISKVRIIQTTTGGAFGGKIDLSAQPYAALCAYITGQPVKYVLTREESIFTTTKRHAFNLYYKVGATKDGKLIAAQVVIIANTGAYASYGPAVLTRSAIHALGPYDCPNVIVDAYPIYTNYPIGGLCGGLGYHK